MKKLLVGLGICGVAFVVSSGAVAIGSGWPAISSEQASSIEVGCWKDIGDQPECDEDAIPCPSSWLMNYTTCINSTEYEECDSIDEDIAAPHGTLKSESKACKDAVGQRNKYKCSCSKCGSYCCAGSDCERSAPDGNVDCPGTFLVLKP
ncbi:MAG TPA: hypothetical protein VMZ31_06940 [Phycisphaerae bacterium]|nr:hypothetical protein [Phycisphaerae bacterium]